MCIAGILVIYTENIIENIIYLCIVLQTIQNEYDRGEKKNINQQLVGMRLGVIFFHCFIIIKLIIVNVILLFDFIVAV